MDRHEICPQGGPDIENINLAEEIPDVSNLTVMTANHNDSLDVETPDLEA